nr:restriction endonuclease subunit S [Paracoccus saliphilus]
MCPASWIRHFGQWTRVFYTDVHSGYDAKFLFYTFMMVDWMSYNEASGVPSLNAKTIENIEFTMPPYDEQKAIAAVLSDMDAEIQTLESRLTKARAVKEGMMQNLLTGRVRLV